MIFVRTIAMTIAALVLWVSLSIEAKPATLRSQEQAIEATVKPYTCEEVHFSSKDAGVVLAGTFSVPKGKGPFPAVVLLHGSGPNDRNEASEGFSRKKFLVLANALNRAGIAVLRYDKRGIGASTGNYWSASFTDFTNDAQAAVNYLTTRKDVAQENIGLLGDSEGGYIAPILATKDNRIAFLVLVSAPALPYVEVNLLQKASLARADGVSEAEIAARGAIYQQAFEVVRSASDAQTAREVLTVMAKPLVESGQLSQQEVDSGLAAITSPLAFELMKFDPRPYLKTLSIPVLAIQGGLDLQVPAKENLMALRRLLVRPDATIVEMPNINHQLQKAKTGAPFEYETISETVDEEVIRLVTGWVQKQAKY